MKKSLIIAFIVNLSTILISMEQKPTPGCIRSNSDGIIQYFLFMHLENREMNSLISLLNVDTMDLKNTSGQNVAEKLEHIKEKVDINPVLEHLKKLSEEKAKKAEQIKSSPPVADLPD